MRLSRAVLALAAVLFIWNIWSYDLWAPDEPYFGEGAREMVVDGRWAVPHVNGVVTTDKPPLFFWLIALFSLPGGAVTSLTARLPSVILGLGSLALTVRLGRRLFGERVAVLAAAMLATTWMFFDKARTAQIDGTLCFLILAALSAFESWRAGDARGRRAGLLFWTAAALAVLAKGPVGFLLPLGVVLLTLAFDRDLRAFKGFAPLTGPLLFLGIVAGWMTLATLGGGGEYSVWGAFREHVLDRAVHGMHHKQPFWYYAKVLPLHLLPWTGLLPGAALLAWRGRSRPADRFLLTWIVFIVIFFSVSTEKRDLYVLPTFPAFALLFARLVGTVAGWDGLSGSGAPARPGRRWVTVGHGFFAALGVLVGLGLPFVAAGREEVPTRVAAAIGVVLAIQGTVALVACLRGKALGAVLTSTIGIAVCYLTVVTLMFPYLNEIKSARPFSLVVKEATAASRAAGHSVPSYRLSNLPEAFSFYSDGVYFPETHDPEALADHFAGPDPVWAVADGDQLHLLPDGVRERLEVVETTRLSRKNVVLVRSSP